MSVPFECDLCHYRNIRKTDPRWDSPQDWNLLTAIRRANIDACWARASSTVKANLRRSVKDYNETRGAYGLRGEEFLPQLGCPHLEDRVGMVVAVQTLNASLRPGKYADHLQYDSVRRTPTWWANAYHAGSRYNKTTMFAKDERKVTATEAVTSGEWFGRFKRGLKLRTGQIVRKNAPFTSEIVLALDKVCQELYDTTTDPKERADLEELMVYVLAEFCGALRGEEVPLLSLAGLLHYWEETTQAKRPYIMLTLHGRFKGETGARWHCLPMPIQTKSNLPTKKWLARALRRKVLDEGRSTGWFFSDSSGKRRKMAYYDVLLSEQLSVAQEKYPREIGETTDIDEFSLWRSGRRGATTAARNAKVDEGTITLMGRWRKRENARGTEPGLPMSQAYTEVKLAVPAMLNFASSF